MQKRFLETQVRSTRTEKEKKKTDLDSLITWEKFLRVFTALDRRVNDDIITFYPVYGCCDLVFVTELERIDDTDDFGKVATGGSRVGDHRSNEVVWVDLVKGGGGGDWKSQRNIPIIQTKPTKTH